MLGLWAYCGLSRLCMSFFLKLLIENVVLKHKIKMYVLANSNCLIKCQLSKLNIMKNRRHYKCCGSRLNISSWKYFYSICVVVSVLQLCTDDSQNLVSRNIKLECQKSRGHLLTFLEMLRTHISYSVNSSWMNLCNII